MPVTYNSKAIIPAPFASIAKVYQAAEDGTIVGSTYNVTLKGKLVAFAGSPNSSGTFWTASGYPPNETPTPDQHLTSLLNKENALRQLFSEHGLTLEIQPIDGAPPTKCNPRIKSIEFQEGIWFQTVDYTISLECDVIYLNGVAVEQEEFDGYISKFTQEWNIEALDETKGQYRLTHSASATGKLIYADDGTIEKQAWERARDYVNDVLGLGLVPDRMNDTSLLKMTGTGLNAYNFLRSQQTNEAAGVYVVTETWLCYDPGNGPAAFDDRNISQKLSVAEPGRQTVSIEGTITGFEERNNTDGGTLIKTRWENAAAKYALIAPDLLATAQTVSGLTLNPTALSSTIGRNQIAGTITYHVDYDNRPESSIPGAISEVISVSNNLQADVFATIPVLGRSLGPILQNINSKTARKRTINIEVQMTPANMTFTPSEPDVSAKILARRPTGSQVYLEEDNTTFVAVTGKYNRTSVFVYEQP